MGTTVASAERRPRHLVADQKHTTSGGKKVSRAATAGSGGRLGLDPAAGAGDDDLEAAYGKFRSEARCLDPQYRPETVNTDGLAATRAAWRALFPRVALILCFLHAFRKVRDRAKHLGPTFDAWREQVWEAYHAETARSFAQRLRRLREWSMAHVAKEIVREKALALCSKRRAFVVAYSHPGGHRTSNLVNRLLRRLDYRLHCAQHRHGSARLGPMSRGYGAGR